MIPQEKCAAVTRALHEAFGVSEFEDIQPITKGHTSSLVFRIVVRGRPYLLKIITRTDDPTRHYECMKAAAEAGIAPRVRYACVEDRTSVTDFVEAAPFPAGDALRRLPATLRALHALPRFPGIPSHINTTCTFLMHQGPALDALIQRVKTGNFLPAGGAEELFARFDEVAGVYPHSDPDLVSSHNDLFKPDNMLFDGRHLWLVDWEAAFANDRYAELAVVANLLVSNEDEEKIFLREYFGGEPDACQTARFVLMQQLAHMFYAMVFLMLGSPLDPAERVPEFGDFRRRVWAGEVDLADRPAKTIYGRMHWEEFLRGTRHPRYAQALRTVAAGRPSGDPALPPGIVTK